MPKEIYVDGNGNENLVSGTINNAQMLPITSGSAINTKDYIDSGASLYSLIHFTPDASLGTFTYSGGKVIKNVNWCLECLVTASINTWVNIGTIDEAPSTTIKIPAVRTGDGTYAGMIEIQSGGIVRFYSKQALSSNAVSFTASYST